MSDVKWIKIMVNIFEDEKVRLVESLPNGDTLLILWFKLLTQAGKCNNNGAIMLSDNIPYTPEMLATIFNRTLPNVQLALKTFAELGLVNINNGIICITNWEKHQNTLGLDKIREQTRTRVAKYRQKQLSVTLQETLPSNSISYSLNLLKQYNKGKEMTNEDVYREYFLQYIPESLHNQQFLEVWADWVHYRRKIKKKLTEDSVKRQIKFLLKQPDPIACIDNSIQNSYQGLFEVKNGLPQNNQTPAQPSTTKMSPEVQKQREFLANRGQNNDK